MKVSIIIPVYNVEAYITECLESVARQIYRGEMECLIVDDRGTDNSIAEAEMFIRNYQGNIRFRILHHNHNRGLSAARNTGVKEALGEYVFFLDSDDAIIPETIEEMMRVVSSYPKVEMVQGSYRSFNGEIISKKSTVDYSDNIEWITENILFHLPISSWNRLLKKDFIMREKISFCEGIIYEDVPYNYQLSLKCRYVGFVRENTYIYRTQRKGSIINTLQEDRELQSFIVILQNCIETYLNHHFCVRKVRNIALRGLWKNVLNCVALCSSGQLELHKKEIKTIIKQISRITPWPLRPFSVLYNIMPIKVIHNRYVVNFFKTVMGYVLA